MVPPTAAPAESHVVQGRTVTLPVEVRVASCTLATWLVPRERVVPLLDGTGLAPYGQAGRALVSVGMIRYVECDLGPYNEFAVALVVKREGTVATLIHHLPVNQGFTLEAGRGIWGFPKFMTRSTIAADGHGGATGTLHDDDGRHILTLRCRRGWVPLPANTTELDTYSFMDGVLRRTPFSMRSAGVRLRPGGTVLTLGTGHPMADDLRSLGLGRPLTTMHVARLSATFGAAEVVATP